MSSIPLPALDVRQQQQPDPLEQYMRIAQLRNAIQNQPLQQQALQQQVQSGGLEVQQKQQALNDQKAITSAMQNWDGKDYNDILPLVIKNGGSGQAVLGLKQKILEQQQAVSTAYKNNSEGAQAQAAAQKTKGDLLDGALSPLIDPKQVSDADLPGALTSTAQGLVQRGILDPQHAQMALQLAQSGNPTQIRQQLDLIRKGNMAQSQILDDAAKQAETQKNVAQTGEAQANTQEKQLEIQSGGTGAMADSRYRNILMNQKLGKPVSAEDQAFLQAYNKQKLLVPTANINLQNAGVGSVAQPSAMAQAVAGGQMKWSDVISPRTPISVKEQFAKEVRSINPNFNSGDFQIEQDVRKDFTSGADSNSLTAINRAREHMGVFMQTAKDVDNGNVQALNKIGNALGTEFGSDKAGNLNIAKQAFSAEVGKAFAGASVGEGDRQELQKSISTASSFQQLAGAARTADSLLAGAQKVLKQKYDQGRQGQPNFGNQPSSTSGSSDPFAQFGGKQH